ncbi:MAG: RHS repeat protein [Clostridia bacterium]|nr:RHS repeat protein [Clostridia bacterium]
MKKIICLLVLFSMMLACFASCSTLKYERAMKLIEKGEYEKAYAIFEELGDSEMCAKFHYVPVHIEFVSSWHNFNLFYDFSYNENNAMSQLVEFYDHRLDDFDRTMTDNYDYDSNGNLIKTIITDHNENFSVEEYTYDNKGRLINKTLVFSNEHKDVFEYTYDESGRLIKENNVSKRVVEYKYDDNGNLIEKINENILYDSKSTNRYEYDEKGNLIKEFFYNAEDVNEWITDYIYGAGDNLIKKVTTETSSDKREYVNEYTYDKNGNLIKDYYYAHNGYMSIAEYTYDDNNNLIKLNTNYNNASTWVKEWIYDENGNLISYTNIDDGEIRDTTECEYKLVYVPDDWDEIYNTIKEIFTEKFKESREPDVIVN